jgi:hypothetical protein
MTGFFEDGNELLHPIRGWKFVGFSRKFVLHGDKFC